MDRLDGNEYLEQVKQVLSEEEYGLLLEVVDKTSFENTAMDEVDIISLCTEVILQSRKKQAHLLSTDRKKELLKKKMQRHIKNNMLLQEADSIEVYQEEGYMDSYHDDSLERLIGVCNDSSSLPKSEIVLQKLLGKSREEISQELGVSVHIIERVYIDKMARIASLYYDALAGIMDENVYNYYQELLKNPALRQIQWKSTYRLRINSALKKYEHGHELTNTEKQVYDTINEMKQTTQQKVYKKI